jgi:transposase
MSDGAAQPNEDPQERIAALEAELASVRRAHDHKVLELERSEHEREQYRKLYTLVLFELERLKRQLFGKKAETVDPNQVQLAFEPVLLALERAQSGDAEARQDVEAELAKLRAAAENGGAAQADGGKGSRGSGGQRGKGHGRRDFDAERAPVETIVLEPPERSLPGGDQLIKIGEEVSEHFDYRPASIVRVRVVRPKYRNPTPPPGESPIAVAELPDRPIPRSVAGAGLIAHVIVQKYGDHMPLHRQQGIFKRSGVHLPRSTLANLVQGGTALLGRIVDAMWQHAREHAAWLAIDATGVLVLAAEQCRRGHFWVVVAQRDHVLFRYTPKHDGSVPAELLAGFAGYVIADASSVYHELYRNEPGIIEVSCWSHARRRFFDALSVDRERALVGIGFIGLLYDAHRAAMDPTTGVVDTAQRRAAAEPVLNKLYDWIRAERHLLVDESPIAKAMNYLVNHRESLSRFLEDGRLRLDNNISEVELRRQAVGRHNWTFCGSDDGAQWNATATSLIASCQLHGIEPWAYLRDVLMLLPNWPSRDVLQLAPKFWAQTREQPQTQQRLAAVRLLGRFDDAHASDDRA